MDVIKIVIAVAVVALVGAIAWGSIQKARDENGIMLEKLDFRVLGILIVLAGIFLLAMLPSVGSVPAGNRGVVLRFGAVTDRILPEGFYLVMPIAESVVLMDVQVQAVTTNSKAASKDLQNVNTQITLNHRLDPAQVGTIYQNLRHDYDFRIVAPAIQEAVKAATAQFEAERLIIDRPLVRDRIEEYLSVRLSEHGIQVDGLSITAFEFSPEFAAAIESKVTATQEALKAENDLRRIEIEAQQRIVEAKAEAEAIRIQAESISKQGGAEYVNLKAIEKWNGVLPQWMSGQATPFVNVGKP